jgi:hypothetical protein
VSALADACVIGQLNSPEASSNEQLWHERW